MEVTFFLCVLIKMKLDREWGDTKIKTTELIISSDPDKNVIVVTKSQLTNY